MNRIGFLVNPVAGMGGPVGLKGTDGMVSEAVRRGAKRRSPARGAEALSLLKDTELEFLTCSGEMGQNVMRDAGIPTFQVVYHYDGESTSLDTRAAVRTFMEHGVNLVLFCGGDGTARDIAGITGEKIPVLGIPAGVKMYSAVFAINPASAAAILQKVPDVRFHDAEIVDVDEEAYRNGELKTRIFGFVRSPYLPGRTQEVKGVFENADEERAKDDIASFILEIVRDDTLYILGAGTTTEHIARKMGLPKTLLGVDAIKGGKVVGSDADERTLLDLIARSPRAKIIVSPIGAQGFILGRGSQQISPEVVRQAGIRNIIVVSTPFKLSRTRALYIDSGDPVLDAQFGDSIQVISGYRIAQRKKIHQAVR